MVISKILVAALFSAALVSNVAAAEYYKHDEGRTYEKIAKCLVDEVGLISGTHFRQNKQTKEVELNRTSLIGDSMNGPETHAAIAKCWKNEPSASARKDEKAH